MDDSNIHIVKRTDQWKERAVQSYVVPRGVLCVELTPDGNTRIKIGEGNKYYSQLPYIGANIDISKYFTKEEVKKLVEDTSEATVVAYMDKQPYVRVLGPILPSASALPKTGNKDGDIRFVKMAKVTPDGKAYIEYVWFNNRWDPLSSAIDIDVSKFATKEELAAVQKTANELAKRVTLLEQAKHIHLNKSIIDSITAPFTTELAAKLAGIEPNANKYVLPIATRHSLGGIIIGEGLLIDSNGRVSVDTSGIIVPPYDDTEVKRRITNLESVAHTHINKSILDATTASYTTAEKSKLAGLENYDDTEIRQDISDLQSQAHTHTNKSILDQTTAPYTTEEQSKLAGLENYTLPTASSDTLGGVKVGDGLTIDADGVLSADGSIVYRAGAGISIETASGGDPSIYDTTHPYYSDTQTSAILDCPGRRRTYTRTTTNPAYVVISRVKNTSGSPYYWYTVYVISKNINDTLCNFLDSDHFSGRSSTADAVSVTIDGTTWYGNGYMISLGDIDPVGDVNEVVPYFESEETSATDTVAAILDYIYSDDTSKYIVNTGVLDVTKNASGNLVVSKESGDTTITLPQEYTLPIASANDLGGIKVGDGLTIDQNGVLSAAGGGSSGGGNYDAGDAIEFRDSAVDVPITNIRFFATGKRANDNYFQMSELEFYDTSDNLITFSDVAAYIGETSSTPNYPVASENVTKLFDGNTTTKMCCYWSDAGIRVDMALTSAIMSDLLKSYRYCTGNDFPSRDPVSWTVFASSDNGATWFTIDTRSNETVPSTRNTYTNSFSVSVNKRTINVKYGDGLSLDQNGALTVIGGGGQEYVAGDGINIRTETIGSEYDTSSEYYSIDETDLCYIGGSFTLTSERAALPKYAFVASHYNNNWNGPVLFSKNPEAVKYNTRGYTSNPVAFTYNNETWYRSDNGYWYQNSSISTNIKVDDLTGVVYDESDLVDYICSLLDTMHTESHTETIIENTGVLDINKNQDGDLVVSSIEGDKVIVIPSGGSGDYRAGDGISIVTGGQIVTDLSSANWGNYADMYDGQRSPTYDSRTFKLRYLHIEPGTQFKINLTPTNPNDTIYWYLYGYDNDAATTGGLHFGQSSDPNDWDTDGDYTYTMPAGKSSLDITVRINNPGYQQGDEVTLSKFDEMQYITGTGPTTKTINVTPATTQAIGGVKVGPGLSVTSDGTLTANVGVEYVAGDGISIDQGSTESSDITELQWEQGSINPVNGEPDDLTMTVIRSPMIEVGLTNMLNVSAQDTSDNDMRWEAAFYDSNSEFISMVTTWQTLSDEVVRPDSAKYVVILLRKESETEIDENALKACEISWPIEIGKYVVTNTGVTHVGLTDDGSVIYVENGSTNTLLTFGQDLDVTNGVVSIPDYHRLVLNVEE